MHEPPIEGPSNVIDLMPRIPVYSPEVACATQWDETEPGGESDVRACMWQGVADEDGCCPWCDMPLPDRTWDFLAGA